MTNVFPADQSIRDFPWPELRQRSETCFQLEKSRQSARECRARKKLRYQYLDDLIAEREKANDQLRDEMTKYVAWCHQLDANQVPDGLQVQSLMSFCLLKCFIKVCP